MEDLQYEAQQSYENDCINADREREFERREDMREDYTEDDARNEEVQANYLTDAKMGL
jgi:hypothetical protein